MLRRRLPFLLVGAFALALIACFAPRALADGPALIESIATQLLNAVFSGSRSVTSIQINPATLAANQVLTYNGSKWTNAAGGGGSTPTWASVLASGNTSGGTNPTVSTGDVLLLPDGSSGAPPLAFSATPTIGLYHPPGLAQIGFTGSITWASGISSSGIVGPPDVPLLLTTTGQDIDIVAGSVGQFTAGSSGDSFVRGNSTITLQTFTSSSTVVFGIGAGRTPNVVINGTGTALTQNATGGFLYLPTCATGAPNGTPSSFGGDAPLVIGGNNHLYMYVGGAWTQVDGGTIPVPLVLTQTNSALLAFQVVEPAGTNIFAIGDTAAATEGLCTIRNDGSIRTGYSGSQIQSLTSGAGSADGQLTAFNYNVVTNGLVGEGTYQAYVSDSRAWVDGTTAQTRGGGLGFAVRYGPSSNSTSAALIQAVKDTAVQDQVDAALAFYMLQTNGHGLELMRLRSLTGTLQGRSDFVYGWTSGAASAATDTGLSRDAAGVVDFGTGAQGSTAGSWKATNGSLSGSLTTYQNVATAGWGVPAIYSSARAIAQTGNNANVLTFTVGAADGSFEISPNINITATAVGLSATVTYTDETSTSRSQSLVFFNLGGSLVTSLTTTGAYPGDVFRIRCKTGTNIVVSTAITSGTYNIECDVKQVR